MRSFDETVAKGFSPVAGVDEAGRGPLAGPVVAAAVVFTSFPDSPLIKDSKKLSPAGREKALPIILASSVDHAIGVVGPEEIDSINIHRGSLLAMEKAVSGLKSSPRILLIDGKFRINSQIPQKAIISGDALSVSIAAASIVAKTTRDKMMLAYHEKYPAYNFAANKGYPTKDHLEALRLHGPCPIHRMTFRGVCL